ncbi:hypothetical protein SEA_SCOOBYDOOBYDOO_177 [Mycobacterium phage ScoobyDoobyDoo]|nr:hypothetical protein SEA_SCOOBYDOOBYDOO_177 [Mycobacterium phage ScoobyDoobyDoo]
MQPDQETVERADSTSPPGYRSDGVATPVQPNPRHQFGGGVHGAEDVSQDDLRDMEARVRAAREALYSNPTETHLPPEEEFTPASDEDLSQFLDAVAKQDAKHAGEPVAATARRRGRNSHTKTAPPVTPPKPKVSKRDRQIEDISDEQLLAEAGVQPFYSTTEAAQFFDKTNQWLYWGLRKESNGKPIDPVFVYPDGTPIEPERVGDPKEGRRRFTLPIIKDILLSNYRRGNVEPDELKKVLRRIRINELGGEWREREGWKKIRGKWVHPSNLEQTPDGKWVKKKGAPDDE